MDSKSTKLADLLASNWISIIQGWCPTPFSYYFPLFAPPSHDHFTPPQPHPCCLSTQAGSIAAAKHKQRSWQVRVRSESWSRTRTELIMDEQLSWNNSLERNSPNTVLITHSWRDESYVKHPPTSM